MILDALNLPIMDSRLLHLERTLVALRETGVPLVMDTNGVYGASGFTDDTGIYYFVPKLALRLGFTVPQALTLFLGGLILLATAVGLAGFWRLFPSSRSRGVAALGLLLLAALTWRISDVYALQMAMAVAFTPWILAALEEGRLVPLGLLAGLAGFLGGYANTIRTHAGTTVWLFLLLALTMSRLKPALKGAALFALLVGLLVPRLHWRALERDRDGFLSAKVPGYQAHAIAHPVWHSLYIGFGYLPNSYGMSYSDTCAAEKVKSVDPAIAYCSPAYERALRTATVEFVGNHPLFALRTLAAKGLRILGYLLVFVNLGWLALYRKFPGWAVLLPFAVAIAFSALPGLLVIPSRNYVLGMTSFSTLLGITLIGLYLQGDSGVGAERP